MNLSSLATKGALIKGAGSLVVLSGASVGGYYVYDSISSGSKTKEFRKGYFSAENRCFKELFPDTEFPRIGENKKEPWNNQNFEAPDVSAGSSGDSTNGCVFIKKEDVNEGDLKVQLETAISNDKIGIFTLFEFKFDQDNEDVVNFSHSLRYQAYFLEKKEGKWEIKFGLASSISDHFEEINSPDNSISVSRGGIIVAPTEKTKYYGKWSANGKETEKLLLDGLLEYFEKETSSTLIYQNKKIYQGSPLAITVDSSKLKKWFEVFKDKKGKWNESKDQ